MRERSADALGGAVEHVEVRTALIAALTDESSFVREIAAKGLADAGSMLDDAGAATRVDLYRDGNTSLRTLEPTAARTPGPTLDAISAELIEYALECVRSHLTPLVFATQMQGRAGYLLRSNLRLAPDSAHIPFRRLLQSLDSLMINDPEAAADDYEVEWAAFRRRMLSTRRMSG